MGSISAWITLELLEKSSLIPEGSSQETFKQFRNLAKEWLQTGKEVTVNTMDPEPCRN